MKTSNLIKKLQACSGFSIDTNIFLYFFDSDSEFFAEAKSIFELIVENKITINVSMMVVMEVLSYSQLSEKEIETYVAFFGENEQFVLKDINFKVAKTASFLRRKYQLRMADAIVLGSAIESGDEVFVTRGKALKKVAEIDVEVLG